VIYLQLLKSHRNRRNSLVLDEGNTLFFIFGKILLLVIIISIIIISYYFFWGYFSFSFFSSSWMSSESKIYDRLTRIIRFLKHELPEIKRGLLLIT